MHLKFKPTLTVVLALAWGSAAASPQSEEPGREADAIVVHHLDQHPASAAAARATLTRLGEAAMDVCGASAFSLREIRASVRASACWRDSMADALGRIGDRALSATFARDERPRRPGPS